MWDPLIRLLKVGREPLLNWSNIASQKMLKPMAFKQAQYHPNKEDIILNSLNIE